MNNNKSKGGHNKNRWSDDDFIAFVEKTVVTIKTESDITEMTRLRKLLRKHAPMGMRSYVAAFLAKTVMDSGFRFSPPPQNRNDARNDVRKNDRNVDKRENRENFDKRDGRNVRDVPGARNSERPNRPEKQDRPERQEAPIIRADIPEDQMVTLFFNIGKSRKVFVRTIIALLVQEAKVDRDRIGDVRVFNNYAFSQLWKDDGQKVIDALNGYMCHGRELAVTYSHERSPDAPSAAESGIAGIAGNEGIREIAENGEAAESAPSGNPPSESSVDNHVDTAIDNQTGEAADSTANE
ncbi:MAG: hypothetical protein Ta2A_01890 [Treponemataceae bacterium]|nr:MAG: hypothetical protein Ta2A_01890 [Treponemataceae bacterium]